MLNVVYLAIREENPPSSYYDHGLLQYLFDRIPHARHLVRSIPLGIEGAVVVIPARNQVQDVQAINSELLKLSWAVVILTGDEESLFPWRQITHPNCRTWVMSPKQGVHDQCSFKIGSGFRYDQPIITKGLEWKPKDIEFFFSGQTPHTQRKLMAKSLKKMAGGVLVEQPGFAQGMDLPEYLSYMTRAKFVPAPCGPVSPDNFRLYEALEAGAVPIADGKDYWPFLFGESVPFPIIDDWTCLPSRFKEYTKGYYALANKVFGWWQLYKRRMVYKLDSDIKQVSGQSVVKQHDITVIMPTSYIPSHPSTEMIEKTIASVRDRLPDVEMIITIDGLDGSYAGHRQEYEEYVSRLLFLINNKYTNMIPLVFSQYKHQTGMTTEALKLVKTPTILYVEHDTPLIHDIPFDQLVSVIKSGEANTIRLNHEDRILDDHKYLQLDDCKVHDVQGVPLIRSTQWSQRPHLSSTEYYRRCEQLYWKKRMFIEHCMYGIVVAGSFAEHKLHVYAPEGNMLRSTNLNGRTYKASEV